MFNYQYHPLDDISSSGAQGQCGSIHASTEMMTVMQHQRLSNRIKGLSEKWGQIFVFFLRK